MKVMIEVAVSLAAMLFMWFLSFSILLSYGILKKNRIGRWTAVYWLAVGVWLIVATTVLR